MKSREKHLGQAARAVIAAALAIPAVALADGGKITGKTTFEGQAPKSVTIRMDADPVCAAAHKEPVTGSEIEVGAGGAVKDVFVWVSDGLGDKKFPAPTEPAVIDQKGCQYHPHVLGLQVGQPLKFLNSDGTLHNVHGMPKKNPAFNFAMPKFVKQKETKLETPEMMHVKCDVHPWMSAYVGVVTNPFYAVTAADGSFTIDGLPAGEYTVEAWQEKLGTQTQKVKVEGAGAATANFAFK